MCLHLWPATSLKKLAASEEKRGKTVRFSGKSKVDRRRPRLCYATLHFIQHTWALGNKPSKTLLDQRPVVLKLSLQGYCGNTDQTLHDTTLQHCTSDNSCLAFSLRNLERFMYVKKRSKLLALNFFIRNRHFLRSPWMKRETNLCYLDICKLHYVVSGSKRWF